MRLVPQVVIYFFYKNLAFTLTIFWFNCFAGFSGQRLYDDWFQSAFNVLFTALPVIVLGLFDQVCQAGTAAAGRCKLGWHNLLQPLQACCWHACCVQHCCRHGAL